MKTMIEQIEEQAKKANYYPRDNDQWQAVWSDMHDEWQIWGFEQSGGKDEILGTGATEQEALRDALDTLIAINNIQ